MDSIMGFFNTLAGHFASVFDSGNGGIFAIIALVVAILLIVLFILVLVTSSAKKKLTLKSSEQEALISAISEITPDMMICKNILGNITYCNDAFAKFVQEDKSFLIGKSFSDMLHIANRFSPQFATTDKRSIEEGQSLSLEALPIRDATGNRYLFESKRTPIIQKKGGTKGVFCVFTDTTELSEAVSQKQEAGQKAELEIEKKNGQLEILAAEILKVRKSDFCSTASRYIGAMGAALSDLDYADYVTYVTKIKNAASDINAENLAERAAQLEDAIKQENLDFITANHPEFISALSALLIELDAERNLNV
ncbi:MAG: PAS domain-containing protein [Oscillospiraceae bacterium]|nr:PAS domain-containing protein [Oscillospiraceae bacterium]